MIEYRDISDLKARGAGQQAPEAVVRLYRQAFAQFGTRALWNWRNMEHPTITQALAVADSLKSEGDLKARVLAIEIERACRAAL
jgi:hypothetical protein